jgi:acetyltransferase-like isoleucine patch superfamily enzyme
MGSKIRLFIALLISLAPCRLIRIVLYRLAFRYRISLSAQIGFGAVIAVQKANIGAARIGACNRFFGPFRLAVEEGAIISPFCSFQAGQYMLKRCNGDVDRLSLCMIKRNARITEGHLIDASEGFELGENSWIAGRGSQFWTHGAEYGVSRDRSVVIGDNCYVGSAVRFAPGVKIGNRCMVGMGSVVTKSFNEDCLLIAGTPARIMKRNWDWIETRERIESDVRSGVKAGDQSVQGDPPGDVH